MNKLFLTEELTKKYHEIKEDIQVRLNEFSAVPEENYFYEFCFCICTPMSKAKNAFKVQQILLNIDFLNNDIEPTSILRNPEHYIRFHNQKADRLIQAKLIFPDVLNIIKSDLSNFEKRNWLSENFKGFGLKESSHFLRNIGFRNLAILDRHILRHLVNCNLYTETPNISTKKNYLKFEQDFLQFAKFVNIPIDELDLLFWAFSTGEILK